jgi:O-antigen/teichoic acid export membrane protein
MANWTGTLISIVIAFFLSPFVVHYLGATVYGVWILLVSLTGYLGLLDLGVRGAVTRYIAQFYVQRKHEEASRLVSSALVIFVLLGAMAFFTSIAVALAATSRFHVPDNLRSTIPIVIIIIGLSIVSSLISNVFGAVIAGLQYFELMNGIETGAAVLKAVAIVFALKHGGGLVALAVINLAVSTGVGLIYSRMVSKLYPELAIRYIFANLDNVRLIFSFGGYLFFLNVSTYLILYTDSIVISAFLSVTMVTFFAIAGNLVTFSRSLITGISITVTPLASSLDAEGKSKQLERIGMIGPRYATMFMLPIAITFLLRGKTFIGLWMGLPYREPAGNVLQILSLALCFGAASQVATSMMIGMNRHRPVVLINVVEGILNVLLSVCLVRSMGIRGVAWGTTIPSLGTSLIFWPLYLHEVFGINLSKYFVSTWIRPAAMAIPFGIISMIVDRHWHAATVWMFFWQVLVTLPVVGVMIWFGCLSLAERHSYLHRIGLSKVGVRKLAEANRLA